jgi:hypothetical protein
MATMIPASVPEQTRSDAERLLFPVLRDGLDASFTVFHSFNLLTHNLHGKFIDGEIDYLIFSPALGFLVLEVKGGAVAYDGKQGTWCQNGQPMKIDPFQQATASKYKLREFFEQNAGHLPHCNFSHGVCFPDVFTSLDRLPSNADPSICITGSQLPDIALRVRGIMTSFGKEDAKPLDEAEAKDLNALLMPCCEYGLNLIDRIGQADRTIFRLTEQQCKLLTFIGSHKQALIQGCAGSGKTIMAVKKARELGSQGKTVLLLAYNRMIGDHLAASVEDVPGITAGTYHKFCRDQLSKAGRLPAFTANQDYWEKELLNAFDTFVKEHPLKYDAVIVDEGQDFLMEYWLTITEMVEPDGYFYIFYDPDQNIRGTTMELPIKKDPFILADNCRNTKTIFEKLKPFAQSSMRIADDAPAGERVFEYRLAGDVPRRNQLGKILHDLVNKQGIDRHHIVILGAHSLHRTCIGQHPKIGNFLVSEEIDDGPNVIHYHTYMKFKGCEADAVILLDVDPADERWADRMTLYTTISRAKHILHVLYR